MDEEKLILIAALHGGVEAEKAWSKILDGKQFEDLNAPLVYRALPSIYYNLRKHNANSAFIDQLKGVAKHTWAQNISRWRTITPLLRMLYEENINYKLLKGAAISCLTNSFSSRVMGDIDILFYEEDAQKILGLLKKINARPKLNLPVISIDSLREPWQLVHYNNIADLDIHLTKKRDKSFFSKILDSPPIAISYQGTQVKIPNAEIIFIHSALHGKLGSSGSDPLQSILDTSKLLPIIDQTRLLNLADSFCADEAILRLLKSNPDPSKPLSSLKKILESKKNKIIKAQQIRKLFSINKLNYYNLKKLYKRRAAPRMLFKVLLNYNPRNWLYFLWLVSGQLRGFETFCIGRFGGFLTTPSVPVQVREKVEIANTTLKSAYIFNISLGSIPAHDFRIKIKLPQKVMQGLVFLEYSFNKPTYWGLYINGAPMGLIPLPGERSGSFAFSTTLGFIEISIRSPVNSGENVVDYLAVSLQ